MNKLILVPSALAISYFAPWAITPLLMVGGAYLCFEGFEKIAHKFLHKEDAASHQAEIKQTNENDKVDLVALEKDKIKGRSAYRFYSIGRNYRDCARYSFNRSI